MFGGFFANIQSIEQYNFQNALLFDGVNDRVNITGAPSGNIVIANSATDCSISLWIKFPSDLATIPMVWSGDNLNQDICFFTSSELDVRFGTIRNAFDYLRTPETLDRWFHLAVTRDSLGEVKAYIDAVELTKNTSASTVTRQFRFRGFGKFNASLANFEGVLDEVSIFSGYLLTLSDIEYLYNAGNGNAATDIATPLRYFKFNESGSDTIAIDEGSSPVNAELENFTGTYWIAH